mmetsp:Transcript_183081/g.580349  ORF Transcript_183081/g.580349 Transcript_183081/m.580349 type:complete len:216 (+) Transcript_183081:139-786(+)
MREGGTALDDRMCEQIRACGAVIIVQAEARFAKPITTPTPHNMICACAIGKLLRVNWCLATADINLTFEEASPEEARRRTFSERGVPVGEVEWQGELGNAGKSGVALRRFSGAERLLLLIGSGLTQLGAGGRSAGGRALMGAGPPGGGRGRGGKPVELADDPAVVLPSLLRAEEEEPVEPPNAVGGRRSAEEDVGRVTTLMRGRHASLAFARMAS